MASTSSQTTKTILFQRNVATPARNSKSLHDQAVYAARHRFLISAYEHDWLQNQGKVEGNSQPFGYHAHQHFYWYLTRMCCPSSQTALKLEREPYAPRRYGFDECKKCREHDAEDRDVERPEVPFLMRVGGERRDKRLAGKYRGMMAFGSRVNEERKYKSRSVTRRWQDFAVLGFDERLYTLSLELQEWLETIEYL
jgi:hypothetical protein